MEIRCPNPECKKYFRLDKNKNSEQRYLMCPYCGEHFENPFYSGENDI